MDVKTILIDKNDNAEGTIMFDVMGNNFRGKTKSFTADELLPYFGGILGNFVFW